MEDDPDAEWRVTVSETAVQSSAYVNSGVAENRLREASTHFLFADIDASLPPEYVGSYTVPYDLPGTFTAVLDGTEYEPTGESYRPDGEIGALGGHVFEVDPGEAVTDARIRWEVGSRTHEWAVDERTIDRFDRTPRAGNVSLSVPYEAVDGETVPVTITAENVGDTGRIRVGLFRERRRDLERFSAEVPAGETHTWEADAEVRVEGILDWTFYAVTASGESATATMRVYGEEFAP